MSDNLDQLVAQVSETTTVEGSAIALLGGLKTRLDQVIEELKQQNIDNATLNQLRSDLDTSETALAAAVAANTPAE